MPLTAAASSPLTLGHGLLYALAAPPARRRHAAPRPRTRRSTRRTAPRHGRPRPHRVARRPRRSGCLASRGSDARGPSSMPLTVPPPVVCTRPPLRRRASSGSSSAVHSLSLHRGRAARSPGAVARAPASARALKHLLGIQRGRAASQGSSPKISPPRSSSRLIWFQLRTTSPAVVSVRGRRTRGGGGGSASRGVLGDLGEAARRRAPRAAARGSRPGTGRRPARRGASRRHRRRPRRRARRPPRRCGERSSARPARDPRGIRGAGGG